MKRKLSILFATATLLVLVACGGQATNGTPQNKSPTASFTATPTSGNAPLTVTFDASGSSDRDGTILSYVWDFGDGTTGSGISTSHSYGAGNFTVRLTVTDDDGATSQAEQSVTVNEPSSSTTGIISGTVTPGFSGTALARRAPSASSWQLDEDNRDFVPGELIVKFKPSLSAQSLPSLQIAGVRLEQVRVISTIAAGLYRQSGLSKETTLELARTLNARDDVLYAHPNYLYHALAEPDDEFYGFQWHYPAINLPQAWDITTGAASTVVGVVDSGILYEDDPNGLRHPDFEGKVLPGYDFISDPNSALDGDGRDPNAFDEPYQENSFHGSHVGGTIAAAANNQTGVAGVDWQAKLVPIRALGPQGGTLADIYEGLLWVAGFSVPNIPDNPNPASVVNMSLGGQGSCPPAVQDALDTVSERAVIVVAAGNENQNAANVSPASCSGVITVGATDFAGSRAPYSNYGSRIDVMAPGGDTGADLNGDGYIDGVLSLGADLQAGAFSYSFLQGTSMAAPHVAGVVSLMKALKPDLSTAEALSALRATARALSGSACDGQGTQEGRTLTSADCGAGLIDAFAALQAVQGGDLTPPGEGQLSFEPSPLEFGPDTAELSYRLTNTGDASLNWALSGFEPAADNPGELPKGSVYLPSGATASGTLAAGESVTTALGIDRSLLIEEGLYQFDLVFEIDGADEQRLTVRFSKLSESTPSLSGPMIVAAFIEDEAGELILSGFEESAGVIGSYSFEALPGENVVVAWSDENGNVTVDEGDYLGVYPEFVPVTAGVEASGIDISIERVIEVDALEWPVEGLRKLEHQSAAARGATE